jgi:hypothetical protein
MKQVLLIGIVKKATRQKRNHNWELAILGIRDTIDKIKHTRISKDTSEHEKKSHDEMAKKYEEKKKFHNLHNQDRPREESAKEKVLKSVMSHGKKFVEKSRQKAQEEAIRQSKKSKKPKKDQKRQGVEPRPQNQFNFGFGNMENFGQDMFSNKKKSDSKEEPKQQGFNFGFGQSDIPYDEMFNFRTNVDHSKLFKKKKSDSIDDVWNPKDFWQ